jgi:hypothetical protein
MIPKVGDFVRIKASNTLLPSQMGVVGQTFKVVGNKANALYMLDVPDPIHPEFYITELELMTVGPLINPPAMPQNIVYPGFTGTLYGIDTQTYGQATGVCTCEMHGPTGLMAVGCTCGAMKETA